MVFGQDSSFSHDVSLESHVKLKLNRFLPEFLVSIKLIVYILLIINLFVHTYIYSSLYLGV